MSFPIQRSRRLRANPAIRAMVRETEVNVRDLIYPIFVSHGTDVREEISSMPGQYRWSLNQLPEIIDATVAAGVPAVILFGIPEEKDEVGSDAYADLGIVQEAIRAIKRQAPELYVIADTCLCEYTSHGHCGMITEAGDVENDATLKLLQRAAVAQADAGADMVAPSDMMDGRVKAIREALDLNGHPGVPIMAYSAKYCSGFYGPFRDAADSAPQFGDRTTYQMDPPNRREALKEVEQDLQEGADIVMVKPAIAYLDIIREVRDRVTVPVAAYNVSGEYSMIKAAALQGWLDERRVALEMLTAIKRAGADVILSYWALDVARWTA